MHSKDCPFCPMFDDLKTPTSVLMITPLNPVVPGHRLFIPAEHVEDAGEDPEITAEVMRKASLYARNLPAANIITSKGVNATQSVFHLHIHVVPRKANDGLPLPWTGQVAHA